MRARRRSSSPASSSARWKYSRPTRVSSPSNLILPMLQRTSARPGPACRLGQLVLERAQRAVAISCRVMRLGRRQPAPPKSNRKRGRRAGQSLVHELGSRNEGAASLLGSPPPRGSGPRPRPSLRSPKRGAAPALPARRGLGEPLMNFQPLPETRRVMDRGEERMGEADRVSVELDDPGADRRRDSSAAVPASRRRSAGSARTRRGVPLAREVKPASRCRRARAGLPEPGAAPRAWALGLNRAVPGQAPARRTDCRPRSRAAAGARSDGLRSEPCLDVSLTRQPSAGRVGAG